MDSGDLGTTTNVTGNSYEPGRTGVLLVDPYNDFLSEGGKTWPRLKEVAESVGLLDHLRAVVTAAREAGIRVFVVPHRRWEPGDYDDWEHPNPTQRGIQERHTFAKGTWGGEFHPDLLPRDGDIVVKEHWAQSGFANTDLDLLLRQHGITHVVLVGLIANTCLESTGRYAMELGYHVTLVRDATAAFSPEMLHAAHDLNGPTYAHAILTTDDLLTAIR
ncbi:MAG: cysteine hydrolase [Nonomuraea sp.]|nr:cysteine hydrolase [Nonomuraea sp.]